MTHARPRMFSRCCEFSREPCFHESLEGGTCVRNKADSSPTVADKRHKPKIKRAGPLRAPTVLTEIVGQRAEDISGVDHLAFGYEQVLVRLENIDNRVLIINFKNDIGVVVNRAVVLCLGLYINSGYRPRGGCPYGCACGRDEIHPLVDALRVLRGGDCRAYLAVVGIHEDFGSVVERRIQDDRRVRICRGDCNRWRI